MRIALAQPPWSGDSIVVSFQYDPVLLGIVRGVPGRKWLPARHVWTIPATPEAVRTLRARASTYVDISLVCDPALAARLNERARELASAQAVKADGDANPDYEFRTKPYAHQRAGLDFLVTIRNGALLWEMGTGKTKTAIDYAEWLHRREHDAIQGSSSTTRSASPLGGEEQGSAPGLSRGALPDAQERGAGQSNGLPRGASGAPEHGGAAHVAVAQVGPDSRDGRGTDSAAGRGLRSVSRPIAADARGPRPLDGAAPGPTVPAVQPRDRVAARRPGTDGAGCPVCGFRVLVITPNSVKRNWGNEIEKHAGHADYVIDRPVGGAIYTITNCEKLSLKKSLEPILATAWSLVACDESTRFKTPSAKRTKALHKIKAKRRVILTGTPITGKPQDAWAQLEFVEPGIFGSWWSFVDRYLVKDYFGAITGVKPSGATELRERIESRSYRVLKEQVLDLPPKVYEDRWVELTGDQKRAYDQMKKELQVKIEGVHAITASTILTQLLRLTQITAGLIGAGTDYTWLAESAKIAELDTLLEDELQGKQVVIFGLYQRELEELAKRYSTATPPPIIYGPTPEHRRSEIIADFQRGAYQYLFVQSHTGGIGINLTAAQYAVYYTRGWSLEDYLQSQDRLHRIGQQGNVTIIHLGAKGTVDEMIGKALADKQNMADLLTGDKARRLAAEVLR